jgi:hypothetical protein
MTLMPPIWPLDRERRQVEAAFTGRDVGSWRIVTERLSPWLRVIAWVHMEGESEVALWRATGAVFDVHEGAVDDDPRVPAAWEPGRVVGDTSA